MPWLFPLPVFAAVLPSTWNTLYAQATALYPCPTGTPLLLADLRSSFRSRNGACPGSLLTGFPKAEAGCPAQDPNLIPSTALA